MGLKRLSSVTQTCNAALPHRAEAWRETEKYFHAMMLIWACLWMIRVWVLLGVTREADLEGGYPKGPRDNAPGRDKLTRDRVPDLLDAAATDWRLGFG